MFSTNKERKPIRKFQASLSKSGKYWVLRDTTMWLIPVNYLAAIAANHKKNDNGTLEMAAACTQKNGGHDGRSNRKGFPSSGH